MTNSYRALCGELLEWAERTSSHYYKQADVIVRARALLDQPVAEGPTDDELLAMRSWSCHGPTFDSDLVIFARAVLARWGNSQGILDSSPQPEGADIHYAWELHDAEGEWQAGGSANSLNDVQREGNRYLQTYSQDGHHKLIIQRHCVTTIEEATNV